MHKKETTEHQYRIVGPCLCGSFSLNGMFPYITVSTWTPTVTALLTGKLQRKHQDIKMQQ